MEEFAVFYKLRFANSHITLFAYFGTEVRKKAVFVRYENISNFNISFKEIIGIIAVKLVKQ